MAELLQLSGLPGIGKTTTAELLEERSEGRLARVHFGVLLREAVEARLGREISHQSFRESFAGLVCEADLVAASAAARELAQSAPAEVCVLDSHAVTPIDAGLLATPDGPRRTALLALTGLVHISAREAVERIVANGGRGGRHPLSATEVEVAESVQVAVTVGYSMAYECPLVVVSGAGDPKSVAAAVESAIRSIYGDRV